MSRGSAATLTCRVGEISAQEVILRIQNVRKSFGGLKLSNNLSADVKANDTLGIIGPNGSGKTALLNLISGAYPVDSGCVIFENEHIENLSSREIAKRVKCMNNKKHFKAN